MNTIEINNKLKGIKNFLGSFPCDNIPITSKRPVSYIINTDISTRPGQHWVALYLSDEGKGEYFDSFGLEPLEDHIVDFINKECPLGYKWNTLPLQSLNEVTCGNYCILFVVLKSKGYKYKDIINIFSTNSEANDILIRNLVK